MGPTLLGRILDLNEIQSGVAEIIFQASDDRGLLLLALDDLRALLSLEREGSDAFFGEPALELNALMRTDLSGHGSSKSCA